MDIVLNDIFSKEIGTGTQYSNLVTERSNQVAHFIYSTIGKIDLPENFLSLNSHSNKLFINTDNTLLINLKKINREKDLNKHFTSVNNTLSSNGTYIGCFENDAYQKNGLVSFLKGPLFSKNGFRGSRYKSYPLAEILGRLAYSGFEIISYREFGSTICFITKKIKEPLTQKISSGIFLKMKRTGKNGKPINIYKVRTMYPYSEFLQDYIVQCNGYNELGKPNNDFRLLPYGKIMRKLYIDEIPQVINLLKGDINIIGVRPLSKAGLKYLPPDVQQERMNYKPGLIPPQIALRLKGIEGVIKAERTYLEEVKKNPFKTNAKYFFLSIFNILTLKVKGN